MLFSSSFKDLFFGLVTTCLRYSHSIQFTHVKYNGFQSVHRTMKPSVQSSLEVLNTAQRNSFSSYFSLPLSNASIWWIIPTISLIEFSYCRHFIWLASYNMWSFYDLFLTLTSVVQVNLCYRTCQYLIPCYWQTIIDCMDVLCLIFHSSVCGHLGWFSFRLLLWLLIFLHHVWFFIVLWKEHGLWLAVSECEPQFCCWLVMQYWSIDMVFVILSLLLLCKGAPYVVPLAWCRDQMR